MNKKTIIMSLSLIVVILLLLCAKSNAEDDNNPYAKELTNMIKIVQKSFPEARQKEHLIFLQKLKYSLINKLETREGISINANLKPDSIIEIHEKWVVYFRSEDISNPYWYDSCFVYEENIKEFKKMIGTLTIGNGSSETYPAIKKKEENNGR